MLLRQLAGLSGVLVTALLLSGCVKNTVLTSKAPDGSAEIQIIEYCSIADCEVDVVLDPGAFRFSRKLVSRSNCFISLAHVAWSPDSAIAAMHVDGGWCEDIDEGYDLRTESRLPLSRVADMLRASIVREYGLKPEDLADYNGYPLVWGNYPGDGRSHPGPAAFEKKYRKAR